MDKDDRRRGEREVRGRGPSDRDEWAGRDARHDLGKRAGSSSPLREGFYPNPDKKRMYDAQAAAQRRAAQRAVKAQRPLPPPKKAERTVKTRAQLQAALEKRRRRGVVKHDWGLTDREARLQKRIQVLEKRLAQRHSRRNRRGKSSGASTAPTSDPALIDEAPGESWWGGLLDTAMSVAPHILPLVAGVGDYEIDNLTDQEMPKTNSVAAAFSEGELSCEVPVMHTLGDRTRFSHREYIGDVYSTTSAFSSTVFPVNPGMNETFPWASRSVLNYEQYELMGACFVFESEGSEYTNSVGLGYVALGSQYDAAAAPFASKKDMFQSVFSVARKPSKTFAHWIECAPQDLVTTVKYVRGSANPANTDIRFYDHCKTTLAVGGHTSGGVIIGELWITYDLLAILPRSDEVTNQDQLYFATTGTGATQATPCGTAWTSSAASTFFPVMSGNTVTIDKSTSPGLYAYWGNWTGNANNAAYAEPIPTAVGGSLSATNIYTGAGGNYTATTNSLGFGAMRTLTLTGVDCVITYPTNVWVGPGAASFRLNIYQLPQPGRESTTSFDFRGREAAKRYESMMAQLRPDDGALPTIVRQTELHALSTDRSGASVSQRGGLARARTVDDELLDALMGVPDRSFDTMCDRLLSEL